MSTESPTISPSSNVNTTTIGSGVPTPPGPPPTGLLGSRVTVPPVPHLTFSARTCLELLPGLTEEQVETEFKHLAALDSSVVCRYKRPTANHKRDVLYAQLAKSLCREVDTIVDNFDVLLATISRSVSDASKHVDEQMQGWESQPAAASQSEDTAAHREHPDASGKTILKPPVRFPEVNFRDFKYDVIHSGLKFTDTLQGGRSIAYFGKLPYSYGRTVHEPAEYPSIPFLATMMQELKQIDPDLSTDTYTCLVTHYLNGKVTIPMHHDNEECIQPGSQIITASFGATRHARFLNVEGAQQDITCKLEHGSVYVMTQESQQVWKHGITYEPHVTEGRISFTFRKLVDIPSSESESVSITDSVPDRVQVPPIAPPGSRPKTTPPPKRVLFLTDSILLDTPEFIFEQAPGHVCIKHRLFELSKIDQYAPQFQHADIVVVSCGVNDMSRYGHTATTLADVTQSRFKHYVDRYPTTKFIFNSVLKSRDYPWLNREVDIFNRHMFYFAQSLRNFSFFDSDKFVQSYNFRYANDVYVKDGGIHITLQVRKLITWELVNAVGYIAGCRATRFRNCEWLRCVTTRSSFAG
jgi:hypothetical protein